MSDPAKTPEEIEDVLASVRRLVSDHSPTIGSVAKPDAAGDVPAPSAVPEASPMPADALVLTPSFRVTDPEDPWVPVSVSVEVAAPKEVDTVVDLIAEDLVAEIVTADAAAADASPKAAASKDDADWKPDDRLASFDEVGGDGADAPEDLSAPAAVEWVDDHSDTPSDEDIADLIRLDGSEASVADFESETGDDNWPESGAEAALLTLVARREPAAEAEDAAAAELEEDLLQENLRSDEGDRSDDDAPEDATSDDAELEDTDEDDDDEAAAEPDSVDTDPVDAETPEGDASQDEAHDETQGETQDETPAEDTLHVTPIFARQNAEDDAQDTEDASIEDLGDTASPFSFPETEDGILDEDTLRDIIVDVVREELQGVLGQRITRNVRKMVRREIRLALAAEDLE